MIRRIQIMAYPFGPVTNRNYRFIHDDINETNIEFNQINEQYCIDINSNPSIPSPHCSLDLIPKSYQTIDSNK